MNDTENLTQRTQGTPMGGRGSDSEESRKAGSLRYNWQFDLEMCFEDPGGRDLIAFDIQLRAGPVNLKEKETDWLYEQTVLRAESGFVDFEDDVRSVAWPARFSGETRIVLGTGARRRRFKILGSGSGGNMHWESVVLPKRETAHVLNYLRRIPGPGWGMTPGAPLFTLSEWDVEFRERVWERRGSIRLDTVRNYVKRWLKSMRDNKTN